MPILKRTVLFCKPGHVMEPPTDKDFEELDREEARQDRIDAAKAKLREAARKGDGKALADMEADIAAMESGE